MGVALIFCRFLHFGAAILIFGGAAYGGTARDFRHLWALTAITGVAWLMLEAGIAGNDWSDTFDTGTISALVAETNFGGAWVFHLSTVAALGAAILLDRGVAMTAGLSLASISLVGHAAMDNGAFGVLHEANAALHLLAGGYWLGALPSVVASVGNLQAQEERRRLIRFSHRGHWAVALVIMTGLGNTALVLRRLPDEMNSPYQFLLLLKIALVLAMTSTAVVNRYVFVPRLKQAGAHMLRRGTYAEIALGSAALALVSAFATFDPY